MRQRRAMYRARTRELIAYTLFAAIGLLIIAAAGLFSLR
jgi:hypothetical protein